MTDQAAPIIAAKFPAKTELEAGKDYYWCRCGKSKTQPFCDGSHKGTDFNPVEYTPDADGPAWFCGCKRTEDQPMCDGTHNELA